jgi:hypothetical protein
MTKKEEILLFIENNNIGIDSLFHAVQYDRNSKDIINMTFYAGKENIIDTIQNNFNDDLIGYLPNNEKELQILLWDTVEIPEHLKNK